MEILKSCNYVCMYVLNVCMFVGSGYDVKLHPTVESQIGLEDGVRLPQTTVTSRWPLAMAYHLLSPLPGYGEVVSSRAMDGCQSR